jgi:putative MATE family efflux protein
LIGFFHVREANVASGAKNYLLIVSLAIPATFVTASICGTFNGSGNSRVPFVMNAVGLVLNAILDVIFIFRFGWGVEGAAAATSIAQWAVCSAAIFAIARKKDRPFKNFKLLEMPVWRFCAQILRWTVPLGVVSILFTFCTMFLSRFAAGFGAGAIAVYRIGSNIESLCWLTGEGISTSIAAFVGQNYGAGRWDRIREGLRAALISWCAWGVAATVFMVTAGRTLFGFFIQEAPLIEMGVDFLRILAICEIFGCLEAIAFGSFRGFGKTLPQSVVSVICNAMRVPLAYALSRTFLGVNGIWLSIAVSASVRGLWAFVWFARHLKKTPAFRQRA